MSVHFWVTLASAMTLFLFAICLVQLYKSEHIRDLRARFLRRKIVPKVQRMLPLLLNHKRELTSDDEGVAFDYELSSLRADLETLYAQSASLFNQERQNIAQFLAGLSFIVAQSNRRQLDLKEVDGVILVGQRIVQELSEIGL